MSLIHVDSPLEAGIVSSNLAKNSLRNLKSTQSGSYEESDNNTQTGTCRSLGASVSSYFQIRLYQDCAIRRHYYISIRTEMWFCSTVLDISYWTKCPCFDGHSYLVLWIIFFAPFSTGFVQLTNTLIYMNSRTHHLLRR